MTHTIELRTQRLGAVRRRYRKVAAKPGWASFIPAQAIFDLEVFREPPRHSRGVCSPLSCAYTEPHPSFLF